MASVMNVRQLQEDLECPLCFELFENAKSLSCLHTFCQSCLADYLSHKRVKNSLVCPVCGGNTDLPSGDVKSLKPNLIVNRLVETWRSLATETAKSSGANHVRAGESSDEGERCVIHEKEMLTQYCTVCLTPICRDCIIGEHRNHAFDDLATVVGMMTLDIKRATEVTGAFLPKLEKAKATIVESSAEHHLTEAAIALEKEINMEAHSALDIVTDAINRQRNAKLSVARALKLASTGALIDKMRQNAMSTLGIARAITDPSGKALSPVTIANLYPELHTKLGNIMDSSVDGGLLDTIGNLRSPSFIANPHVVKEVNFGSLKYPKQWRLTKIVTLPPNRIGDTLSMRALSDGKLAIGYKAGGVDIFDPVNNPGQHRTILSDVKILDFTVLQDGVIAVVTLGRKLLLINQEGNKLNIIFNTPLTSGLMSVDVDEQGELLVGFAEHKSIQIFNRVGGDPKNVITLGDFDPWKVIATKMGKIITKNKHFIKIFERSGKVKATISEEKPLCTFATADKYGNIFTCVLRKAERISVAKHRFDGSFEENITEEQAVYKINNERYWFGLAALGHDCLAVSDTRSVFIYRNAPVLPDLLKLAK